MKVRMEMTLAPFHLIQSFYPIVEFEAGLEFGQRPKDKPLAMNVDVERLKFDQDKQKKNRFHVELGLNLTWPGEEHPPYLRARILHVGDFVHADEIPEAIKQRHMYLSAPSILYSGAREYIKIITSNGPYGAIILPSAVLQPVPVGPRPEKKRATAKT